MMPTPVPSAPGAARSRRRATEGEPRPRPRRTRWLDREVKVKRALLIGCQTGGLRGVDGDVDLMDHALTGLGFSTITITGPDATAARIRAEYRALISASGPNTAAVVYYSGHGGRVRNPASTDPAHPQWLQFLVPSDAHDPNGQEPRVLLAEELHLLGAQLTAETSNATVLLDCCHAARM